MYKCLKIMLSGNVSTDFLQNTIQPYAKKFSLEGTAQILSEGDSVCVIVCGEKEHIDLFLDELHGHMTRNTIDGLEIEPFLKNKDYRGVFRIIE